MKLSYSQAVESYLESLAADPIIATTPGELARVRREIERRGLPAGVAQKYGVSMPLVPLARAIAAVVPSGAPSTGTPPPAPAYECDRCKDAGYVRHDVAWNHPLFGQGEPCPVCSGGVAKDEHRARLRKEYRGLHPLDASLMREARRVLETSYFARAIPDGPLHADIVVLAEQQLAAARAAAAQYAKAWPGTPLVFVGPPGNGKTTLAAKLYASAWREGMSAIFVTGWKLQQAMYQFGREKGEATRETALTVYETVDLLVIDEADHAMSGDKLKQGSAALFALVDARLRRGLPLVLTSNALPEALQREEVGAAIMSRLSSAGATWIEMDAVPDARPFFPAIPRRTIERGGSDEE